MTEFKFRGYSKTKEEYVYGDLIHTRFYGVQIVESGTGLYYAVDPESVEILTGVEDGEEIYESDPFNIGGNDDQRL